MTSGIAISSTPMQSCNKTPMKASISMLLSFAKAILAVAVALYLIACGLLYVFQGRFLFPGAYMPLPDGIESYGRRMGFEPVDIKAADGTALHLLNRAPQPGKAVILVFHGNASYPESYGFLYADWMAGGHGIVAPVARGYPRSPGAIDGEIMLADALAIRDWIAATYPDNPVIVFGQSLGTGPAVHVAARRDVAGLILVSPFLSMLALVGEKLPWLPARLLLASPFRSDLEIGKVTAPIAIFHGDQDTLIPPAHGEALAKLAKSDVAFHLVPGAGHNDGLFSRNVIVGLESFIDMISRKN